jgi:hypothetical protein
LEAIRAPTRGKARKGNTKMSTPLSPPVPQLLGGCTDLVATYTTILAAHRRSERPASDHASQEVARWLIHRLLDPGLLHLFSQRYSTRLPSPERYDDRYEVHSDGRTSENQIETNFGEFLF